MGGASLLAFSATPAENPAGHDSIPAIAPARDDSASIRDISSSSPTKENESPFDSDPQRPSSVAQSNPRVSPLSWQRRPNSQLGSRSRPLSLVAAEKNLASKSSDQISPDNLVSKDQIAQSLAGKDPSWFRQTTDRSQGSAALRRNQVEDIERVDMGSARAQLPGMSRESLAEPSKAEPTSQELPTTMKPSLGSPFPLSPSHRINLPGTTPSPERGTSPVLASTGRTSPIRSTSPTKGMGGFVQSAMMKRSDSVSKRWSVQSPQGLARAESIASNRTSRDFGRFHGSRSSISSRPLSMIGPGFQQPETERRGSIENMTKEQTTSPVLDISKAAGEFEMKPMGETTPPSSPSKTMESRRWSPTKASWLESALSKPESPKLKIAPAQPQQPAWMVELNKNKGQKGSIDTGKPPSTVSQKHEVSIGGLMRSSAPGTNVKPSGTASIPEVFASPSKAASVQSDIGLLRGGLKKSSIVPSSDAGSDESKKPPVSAKPKPEALQKIDFRANLKHRPAATPPGGKESSAEEFRSVVGSLRRTVTQNYKAPDELKDNILRGKAALNATGGPKKSEQRDEFKEAILKKKEDFKKAQLEGRGVTRKPSIIDEDKPVPEGLAKRIALEHVSQPAVSVLPHSSAESLIASVTSEVNPTPAPALESNAVSTSVLASSLMDGPVNAPTATIVAKGPKSVSENHTRKLTRAFTDIVSSSPQPPVVLHKEPSAPGEHQGQIGGSLADRFNPALASILARGPPAAATSPLPSSELSSGTAVRTLNEPQQPGPQLTHMTKSRARGPKRKAPSSALAAKSTKPIGSKPEFQQAISTPILETSGESEKVEPAQASMASIHEQVASASAIKKRVPPPMRLVEEKAEEKPVPSPSPKKLDMGRMSKFDNARTEISSPIDVLCASSNPSIMPKSSLEKTIDPFKASASKPALKVMEKTEFSRTLPDLSLTDSVKPNTDMPSERESQLETQAQPNIMHRPPSTSPKPNLDSPTLASEVVVRPLPVPSLSSNPVSSPPVQSPTKSRDPASMLRDFFGPEQVKRDYQIDTAGLLSAVEHDRDRMQTLHSQFFQVIDAGKKQPVPAQHERVLFEREMYLCLHKYQLDSGKQVTEAYFWAGDEVSPSVVEDSVGFVSQEVQAMGAQLVRLRQGKETREFIQALGGIVIVRRSSSSKYDSLAPSMLCGRRYLGQIVFDEVDFVATSLCSGFPFLITQHGKCHLWKGKGSDIDELSCARLIGMDLTLTGELDEVDDGSEPDSFWDIFGGRPRLASADHWRLKPNYQRYCSRVFCVDISNSRKVSGTAVAAL